MLARAGNEPAPNFDRSPHSRGHNERKLWQNPREWGYHKEQFERNTPNLLQNNYAFRHRRDSGWSAPILNQSFQPRFPNNTRRMRPQGYNNNNTRGNYGRTFTHSARYPNGGPQNNPMYRNNSRPPYANRVAFNNPQIQSTFNDPDMTRLYHVTIPEKYMHPLKVNANSDHDQVNYLSLNFYSVNLRQGIQVHFLLDTGAQVSILNAETFNAIQHVQKHVIHPLVTTVRAANETIIPFKGLATITFKVDKKSKEFKQTFWIASAQDSCRANILGIDWISNHCAHMNFSTDEITLRCDPLLKVPFVKLNRNAFPFFSKLFLVQMQNHTRINAASGRILQLKPYYMSHLPKDSQFIPSQELLDCNLIIYETKITDNDAQTYPLIMENQKNHIMDLPVNVGYIKYGMFDNDSTEKQYNVLQLNQMINHINIDLEELNKIEKETEMKYSSKTVNRIENRENNREIIKTLPTVARSRRLHSPDQFEVLNQKNKKLTVQNTEEKEIKEESFDPQFNDFDYNNKDQVHQMINELIKDITPEVKTEPKKAKFLPNDHPKLAEFTIADQEFLNKFDFKTCNIGTDDKIILFKKLIANKDLYSQTKYDIGCIKRKFHITLKEGAILKKQRSSKVKLQQIEKFEALIGSLTKAKIIEEVGQNIDVKIMGPAFINPIILIPKGEHLKLVIDARFLNSVTNLDSYSYPLEPLQCLLDRVHGKYFCTTDMSCAYHQVPLTEETKKLVSFVVGGLQYTFNRGFYGLGGLPNFFTCEMTKCFRALIEKRKALSYLDDILLMAATIKEMFEIIDEHHDLLRKSGMKAAPDKTFFFQTKVQYLGHEITEEGTQPIASRVEAIKRLKSPENKNDMMRILGALNFYSKYFDTALYPMCKPFFNLIHEDATWIWKTDNEVLMRKILGILSADTIRAIPNTKYPFRIHTDASNIGIGAILIQDYPDKPRIVSFNSRCLDEAEQKLPTIARELAAIVWALQIYEHLIIGSKFEIVIVTDHKPILFLWSSKSELNHRYYKFQTTFTKFSNLRIEHRAGKLMTMPDLLSRNETMAEAAQHKLQHKKIPKDINFIDSNGNKITYFIEHEEKPLNFKFRQVKRNDDNKENIDPLATKFDTHPIIAKVQGVMYKFRLTGPEGNIVKLPINKINMDKIFQYTYYS